MSDSVKELMDLAREAFPGTSEIKLEVQCTKSETIAQMHGHRALNEQITGKGETLELALKNMRFCLREAVNNRIVALQTSAASLREKSDKEAMKARQLAEMLEAKNEHVIQSEPVRPTEIRTQEQADAAGVGQMFRAARQSYPDQVITVLQPVKAAEADCGCSGSERCPSCRE